MLPGCLGGRERVHGVSKPRSCLCHFRSSESQIETSQSPPWKPSQCTLSPALTLLTCRRAAYGMLFYVLLLVYCAYCVIDVFCCFCLFKGCVRDALFRGPPPIRPLSMYMYMCMCIYIYREREIMCVYIYIYIHIHMYIHTHKSPLP